MGEKLDEKTPITDHMDGGLEDVFILLDSSRRPSIAHHWMSPLGSVFDNTPADYLQPTSGSRARMDGSTLQYGLGS